MKLKPTRALQFSGLAALVVITACSSASPQDEDSSAADVLQADAGSAGSSADAEDTAPDIVDTGSDTGPGVPVNLREPQVDLESVSGIQRDKVTYVVPGLGTDRTLDVRIWYATDDEEGEAAVFALGIFFDEFAWEGASVLPPLGTERAPLVVFSHGGLGFPGQISTVARQFVRNGWVVVAPTHPGHVLTLAETEDLPYSFPVIRAFDVIEAIDHVENLPEDHPLSGRVDTSRVLAMGHSFGGQNAWILGGLPLDLDGIKEGCGDGCTQADIAAYEAFSPDPRVVAGVSLESLINSNLLPDESFAQMQTPMLHISGTEGNDATGLFARAAAADLTWVSLIGGCHESSTGTLPCRTLELEDSLRATSVYAVSFGTRHLLGSSDPSVMNILDGSVEVSPSAVLQRSLGAP